MFNDKSILFDQRHVRIQPKPTNKSVIDLDYFNALEDDLLKVARYVEFCADNYKTYSVEFVRLLLAAGSEVDVACKTLIKTFEPKAKAENIGHYRKYLLRQFPEIADDVIVCPRFGLRCHPWKDWHKCHPIWWDAYNNVKHYRVQHCQEAKLENVLNAICGLGVIMQYFGHVMGTFTPKNFRGEFFRLHLTTFSRPPGWKTPYP